MVNRESWTAVRDAIRFSSERHRGQLRKDGITPYLDHLVRVFYLVAQINPPTQVLCAALLHDTIEDTATSYDDLETRFGAPVADLVAELSEDKRLPRDRRKNIGLESLDGLSSWAKLISLADTLDNLFDLELADIPREKKLKQLERSHLKVQRIGETAMDLSRAIEDQIDRVHKMLARGSED